MQEIEVICSFCKERKDIQASDGDIHMCRVCNIENFVLNEWIFPKLRQIAIDIVDKNLLEKK